MAATVKQIKANRRNSKKSTGPITEPGKKNSSRNALKHGLRSKELVLPGEDPAGYDRNSVRAAGRSCGRCDQPMTPSHDVRKRADGTWAHETCPR